MLLSAFTFAAPARYQKIAHPSTFCHVKLTRLNAVDNGQKCVAITPAFAEITDGDPEFLSNLGLAPMEKSLFGAQLPFLWHRELPSSPTRGASVVFRFTGLGAFHSWASVTLAQSFQNSSVLFDLKNIRSGK